MASINKPNREAQFTSNVPGNLFVLRKPVVFYDNIVDGAFSAYNIGYPGDTCFGLLLGKITPIISNAGEASSSPPGKVFFYRMLFADRIYYLSPVEYDDEGENPESVFLSHEGCVIPFKDFPPSEQETIFAFDKWIRAADRPTRNRYAFDNWKNYVFQSE